MLPCRFLPFLRRIAALFYDKNGGKMPGMVSQRTFEQILNSFLGMIFKA